MANKSIASAIAETAAPPPEPPAQTPAQSSYTPPSRVGKRGVVTRLSPEAHRSLKLLAIDLDRPVQSLMVEAVNELFAKYRRPTVASCGQRRRHERHPRAFAIFPTANLRVPRCRVAR